MFDYWRVEKDVETCGNSMEVLGKVGNVLEFHGSIGKKLEPPLKFMEALGKIRNILEFYGSIRTMLEHIEMIRKNYSGWWFGT